KPDRFPSPLFLFALGCLDARSSGNYAERCHIKCEMKALWMDSGVREMAALSALAALGCGLAAVQGDLFFVVIFGAGCAVTIIEAIRRLQCDHRVRGGSVAIRALPDLCFGILSGRLGHLDP